MARFSVSICTALYGRYVLVRHDIGTRTARYRAVLSKSAVDSRLKEKEEEGEEEKGEKRDIPALLGFPARSVARGRFFAGGLPSPIGEMRRERRRELPTRE
ncbi:hypothetical protein B296_00044760 [Ensete ventricosum]|uniref:Uncharacterized protein n=1 Tax=Ensete ventricosum TaxID=4639 RepID=A0A426YMG3_ENSVE|nr:hypothetical protein B296_00044760 [Ensete ventricosum]